MPVLNSTNQITESALANLSRSLEPKIDLAMAIQKQLTIDFTPIFEAQNRWQELFASSLVFSVAEVFRKYVEQQGKMFEMLRESLTRAVPTNLFENIAIPLAYPQKDLVPDYDAEIVEYIPRSRFGLEMTIEGRFLYEGSILQSISTNSKHGKLFKMFLNNDDNYVTDKEVRDKIGVVDEDRGVNFIKKDFVKYLRKDGLEAKLYRQRKEGYKLLSVKKILN